MEKENIHYSNRQHHKIKANTVIDALFEAFQVLLDTQLAPAFEKMIDENTFRDMKAFADYDSGYNHFRLEIFGFGLPDNIEILIDPNLIQDSFHWKQNIFDMNEQMLTQAVKEMERQNILGNVANVKVEGTIAVYDYFYGFHLVWACQPRPDFATPAQNVSNN